MNPKMKYDFSFVFFAQKWQIRMKIRKFCMKNVFNGF